MEIKEFKATIASTQGSTSRLTVTGKVYVSSTAVQASLARKVPQGFNPRILALDLELSKEGGGNLPVFQWVDVGYEEAASKGQFTQVTIHLDGKTIATVDVT